MRTWTARILTAIVVSGAFGMPWGLAGIQPPAVLKTPENREISPFTGCSREHRPEICEKLIAGVLPYFDSETGMPGLKGISSMRITHLT